MCFAAGAAFDRLAEAIPASGVARSVERLGVAVLVALGSISYARTGVWHQHSGRARGEPGRRRALPRDEMDVVRGILATHLRPGHEVRDLKSRRAGSRRFVEFSLRVPPVLTVHEAHLDCDALEEALKLAFAGMVVMIHVEPNEAPVEKPEYPA